MAKNFETIFTDNVITNLTMNRIEKQEKRKEYISFQLSDPIFSFAGRKTELLEIHRILEEQKKLVICGLGGIGKSELIRAYCKEYQTAYQNNFIWINAETDNDLKKSFYELATELSVETTNIQRERNLKEIVKEEYQYFQNEKCLVIFDNAMCLKEVQAYFPSTSSNISVLLSSQNREWGTVNKFELDVLTEDESIELMNTLSLSLSLSDDQEDDVKTLVQMLQYLPLAIQQAAAYIIDQKYVSDTYKIRDYINIFEKEEAILAVTYDDRDAPFPDYSEQLYDKTIHKTLQITLVKIKNELALKILYICAFLAPDNIEKSFFTPLTKEDITKLNEATRVLEKYFLIKVKHNCKYTYFPYSCSSRFNSISNSLLEQTRLDEVIFVHRVIQKIIRYILKSQQEANLFIKEALVLATSINDLFINGRHVVSILKHSDQTVCLDFYENYCQCQNKEPFLRFLTFEIYFDTFKLLLNADKNFDMENSRLPIHVAIGGSKNIMQYIIEKGANILKQNETGSSAIQAACEYNQLDMLDYLIEQGSSVNVVNIYGETPLHRAVLNNHLDIVKYLVQKGASKDTPNKGGFIPLHLAAHQGHVEILEYLLKNGAPVDHVASNGITSLHLASENGHLGTVQCLVDNGAAINKTEDADGYTSLLFATLNNHLHIIKYLFETGANVTIPSKLGLSPLHIASANNKIKIVHYLVKKCLPINGFNINSTDIYGRTPLFYATKENNLDVVVYLLENGASIDISNHAGTTCLHIAAQEGHLELVKYLVNAGAVINHICKARLTATDIAFFKNHAEVAQFLLDHGGIVTSDCNQQAVKKKIKLLKNSDYHDHKTRTQVKGKNCIANISNMYNINCF